MRILTAIPVYNEEAHIRSVLAETRRYVGDILVVNDGSTDNTRQIIHSEPNLHVVCHPENRGYGAALITAFEYALDHHYDTLVTMDCDGQHQPDRIPVLLEALHHCEIVSGSRYLRDFRQDTPAPSDRRSINHQITTELNERYRLELTDSFCGFKAYRVPYLKYLRITEKGWGMPLQLWVHAARQGFRIHEIAVPRVYLDSSRAFGGILNDPTERLNYYREVMERAEMDPLPPLPEQSFGSYQPHPLCNQPSSAQS